jgi:excisionase family DNA binding protein
MTKQLLSADEAAAQIGVSRSTVKAWIRRTEHALPSVQVGETGRVRKVVAGEIDAWLSAEAARKTGTAK